MRILHTSDWHLGQTLCGRRRYDEFEAFLDWLLKTIEEKKVDVLLVAGDVFDSGTPSARAQNLYYNFLGRLAALGVHAVITAGNHDSPLFLNAPARLLSALRIHVVSSAEIEEELVVINDEEGRPRLIVAAVPYPRDRDFRDSLAGESAEDKEKKLAEAIRDHYARAAEAARKLAEGLSPAPPIAAMGHLFAAGGEVASDDRVRDLQVGSLGRVPASTFPPLFDYVALGHLHLPQTVGGEERLRYSGAPLAMSFGEAGRPKSVALIDFTGPEKRMEISALEAPVFQALRRISGDWAELEAALHELAARDESIWLEVEYTGSDGADLRERLWELTEKSRLEILRVRNQTLARHVLEISEGTLLTDLTEAEIFQRCLDIHAVAEEERGGLWAAYNEITLALRVEGL